MFRLKKRQLKGDSLFFLQRVCLQKLMFCVSVVILRFQYSPLVLFSILVLFFLLSFYPHPFTPSPLALLFLLSHWDDSHVLWRPSRTKPHTEAVAGGRKRRRRRLQKKLCQCSWPRHRPETKLDVVKLSNYLRKLQQNLKRQKTDRERSSSVCCETSKANFISKIILSY